MKKTRVLALMLLVGFLLITAVAYAASAKTYQVTGPVLDVSSDMIVVQKGKDRWEIARDSNTKVPGDLKKGDKVTITYRMTAETVEVKPTKSKSKSK